VTRWPALTTTALLVALGPALLRIAPTPPPHDPVAVAAAAPVGAAAGVLLFACLARRRPRALLTPLALATALVVAAVGTSEEAIWRAFAFARLAGAAGPLVALAVTSAAFAAVHLPALRARGACVQLVTGTVFGGLFAVTGSLVACAVAHAVYNVLAVLGRRSAQPASALTFHRAEKRFDETVALHPLDLAVERGELVALLGPNGAGKTTLVSLALGLRRPSGGSVRVFGEDPRDWRARARLGATPQEMGFPPTLRVREILELARAHATSPPPLHVLTGQFGLDTIERRQVGALSGGQRRRVALALAFAGAPELVVLDEPTTGLDVESRRQAWEAIRAFAAGGGTVLLTTHSLEEADALAQRVVVLARGAVVADAPPEILKACAGADLERAFVRLTEAVAT
jgi:ABC-2 type transport system ATP-binding protein